MYTYVYDSTMIHGRHVTEVEGVLELSTVVMFLVFLGLEYIRVWHMMYESKNGQLAKFLLSNKNFLTFF